MGFIETRTKPGKKAELRRGAEKKGKEVHSRLRGKGGQRGNSRKGGLRRGKKAGKRG